MPLKTIVRIPVPVYLHKFLIASKQEDYLGEKFEFINKTHLNKEIEVLTCSGYTLVFNQHREAAENYFIRAGDYIDVYLEITRPTIERLFEVVQELKRLFKRQLIREMTFASEFYRPGGAMGGLKKFYESCDISNEDFRYATGYKHWQRHQQKIKKRRENAA